MNNWNVERECLMEMESSGSKKVTSEELRRGGKETQEWVLNWNVEMKMLSWNVILLSRIYMGMWNWNVKLWSWNVT